MAKQKRMDQIRAIIQNYLLNNSIKATSRQLMISKNTVREYVRRAKDHDEDLSKILKLNDDQFRTIFYGPQALKEADRAFVFSQLVQGWIKELRRVGVTRYLLWQEYRRQHPQGYGYSQFCERLRKEIGRRDLTLSLSHPPGEVMMVDFAGKKLHWIDSSTAEVHPCEVLVCVFPHSHFMFVIALVSQKIADFVHGLNQALLYFGATPKVLLSDNLKTYVSQVDRYEPSFTQLCEQLGAHYHLDLQATRVAKPKDKASVENAVGLGYKRIYAPLRNKVFYSLKDLNQAILDQLDVHNAKPFQKKEGSRREIYDAYELPLMKALPNELFEIKKITHSKVQRNYHIYIGEEKNFYSVPYQYVGEKAEVIYTSSVVEVFIKGQRIAVHQRLASRGSYRYKTENSHMPEKHRQWKKIKGYNAQYFLNEGLKIGPATHWAIQNVLVSKIQESQTYNSCKGILHLGRKYSSQRLEKAAVRCQKVNKVTYGMLKRILHLNLDQVSESTHQLRLPDHDNIRGPEAYQ